MMIPINFLIIICVATPVRACDDDHQESCNPASVQAPTLIQQKIAALDAAASCPGIYRGWVYGKQDSCDLPIDPKFKWNQGIMQDWNWCCQEVCGELYTAHCFVTIWNEKEWKDRFNKHGFRWGGDFGWSGWYCSDRNVCRYKDKDRTKNDMDKLAREKVSQHYKEKDRELREKRAQQEREWQEKRVQNEGDLAQKVQQLEDRMQQNQQWADTRIQDQDRRVSELEHLVPNLEQHIKNLQEDGGSLKDSMRQQMKANWAAGRYTFMGQCKHGQLVEEAKRTVDDQCGQCDPGYELTVGDTGDSPPTCERKVACQCTGRSNQFKCSDGSENFCASDEECYRGTDEWWTKESWHEGCKLASCHCTGNQNQYQCSDGSESYCKETEACFRKKDEMWTKGNWSEGCKEACRCTGQDNQFECSNGDLKHCASHQNCYRDKEEWWTMGAWGEGCQ